MTSDRMLGLLASTLGKTEEARDHYEESLRISRKGGLQPEIAWTSYNYADMLLTQKSADNRDKALALLEPSLVDSHGVEDGAGEPVRGSVNVAEVGHQTAR